MVSSIHEIFAAIWFYRCRGPVTPNRKRGHESRGPNTQSSSSEGHYRVAVSYSVRALFRNTVNDACDDVTWRVNKANFTNSRLGWEAPLLLWEDVTDLKIDNNLKVESGTAVAYTNPKFHYHENVKSLVWRLF
jgi:hypothetical protein